MRVLVRQACRHTLSTPAAHPLSLFFPCSSLDTKALPQPPLPPFPEPVTSLAAAIQEPARLADAYTSARNVAAAQQWADAAAGKGPGAAAAGGGGGAAAPVVLPPSAAAGRPLVVATAHAAAGAPNPTARTVARDGALADPVEAVVQAGADAVSGRPPRGLLDAVLPALLGEPGRGAGRAQRRALLQQQPAGAQAAAPADVPAGVPAAKPTMSKYKLFKTADPHRVRTQRERERDGRKDGGGGCARGQGLGPPGTGTALTPHLFTHSRASPRALPPSCRHAWPCRRCLGGRDGCEKRRGGVCAGMEEKRESRGVVISIFFHSSLSRAGAAAASLRAGGRHVRACHWEVGCDGRPLTPPGDSSTRRTPPPPL